MDNTEPRPSPPARDSIESDPAYDYAEDAPIADEVTEEEGLLEEAERFIPLETDDFLGEDQPVVPLDTEEFLKPEENE
jgi:hypothetical protein